MKNDTVIIKNDKIYTSYFARACKIVPNKRLLSIALTSPEGWGGGYLRELNPPPHLLYKYKSGDVTEQQYKVIYRAEVLDRLQPIEIVNKAKGKVLCCWENKGFCHRHLFTQWIQELFGDELIGGEI